MMKKKEFIDEFNDLTTKFLFLNCNNSDSHSKIKIDEISILLNNLNSLDYEKNNTINNKAALRLLDSILRIPPAEHLLIMKSCFLMSALLNKQKISLPEIQFQSTLEWLLNCLSARKSDLASEILSVLSILFKNHGMFTYKYFHQMFSHDGTFINLLNSMINSKSHRSEKNDDSREEILSNIISCVDSLLTFLEDENVDITDKDLEILSFVGSKIILLMYNSKIFNKDSSQYTIYLNSSLSVLQKIALNYPDWCECNIGDLLGIAREFLHYGIIITSNLEPRKVLSSQQSIVEPHLITSNNKGGKIQKTRKLRTVLRNKRHDTKIKDKKNNERFESGNDKTHLNPGNFEGNLIKTSDSDFSETESGKIQGEKHRQSKIRLKAISLIEAITKNVEKKVFFGYCHCLLPIEDLSSNELLSDSYDIFTCGIKDPNPKCRLAAFHTISLILHESKMFLMQAENIEKGHSSFTPFSVTLGNTIVSIFEIFTKAMENENSLPVLTQILKSVAVLIQVTPFTRLKTGFVPNCIHQTQNLIHHKDSTIQVAALMVIEFFVSTTEITGEISQCLEIPQINTKDNKNENKLTDSAAQEIVDIEYYDEIDPSEDEFLDCNQEATTRSENSNNKIPWLLKIISDNLEKITYLVAIPVRIECLKVLTALASHVLFFKDYLQLVANVLKKSLADEQSEIRIHAAKCLDTIGHSINTFLLINSSQNEIIRCENFWINILPCVIEKIQDSGQSPLLKSVLCDFLSNIGVHIFEKSSHSQKMMLISLLTGISCNEDSLVKASAVRALAVYVMFPSLRDDICFVENTATYTVELLKEKNSYVRIKSSWSLGNISNALIPISTNSKLDRVSDELLYKMFEISIDLISDNDKIKCNAVRTIGNLLRLIIEEQVASIKWRLICFQAIEKLTQCITKIGSAKVKWNACYAIGNFMKNDILFTTYDDFNWQNNVFPALCDVIINSPNFKVRINGVNALNVINNRNRYGQHFNQIWCSLLASIEQSDILVDFNEYKHRDNLQEQLCFMLCHMIKIANKDDFIQMKNNLINMELIKPTWKRVINRIIPEDSSSLLNCSLYLQSLLKNNELNAEQKTAIIILMKYFIAPDEI